MSAMFDDVQNEDIRSLNQLSPPKIEISVPKDLHCQADIRIFCNPFPLRVAYILDLVHLFWTIL